MIPVTLANHKPCLAPTNQNGRIPASYKRRGLANQNRPGPTPANQNGRRAANHEPPFPNPIQPIRWNGQH